MGGGAAIRPATLVFRCYVRPARDQSGMWVAHCIDVDLWASGKSLDDAQERLTKSIQGYIAAAVETDDAESIPRLLRRRAQLRYLAQWYLVRFIHWLARGRPTTSGQPYRYTPPFQLGRAAT